MKKQLLFGTLFLTIAIQNSIGGPIDPLRVGDYLPVVITQRVLNVEGSLVNLSSFKGKYVILDFWATYCAPCVAMFPSDDSLQKEHGRDVQFVAVTDQKMSVVQNFLSHYKKNGEISFPFIVEDTTLSSLFPHTYIPHYVWINKEGKIIGITDGSQVNKENIDQLSKGQLPKFVEKDDSINTSYDIEKDPVFQNSGYTNAFSDSLFYQSSISGYRRGFLNQITHSEDRIAATDISIEALYAFSVGKFQKEFIYPNRFIANVSDSTLKDIITGYCPGKGYTTSDPEIVAWQRKYSFCYELHTPSKMSSEDKYQLMVDDLNRYFGPLYHIKGAMEERSMQCLVIRRTSDIDKIKYVSGKKKIASDSYSVEIHGGHVRDLMSKLLQNYQLTYPVLDETGYSGPIDLELFCKLSDLKALNKELAKFDLEIDLVPRTMKMVVVSDLP